MEQKIDGKNLISLFFLNDWLIPEIEEQEFDEHKITSADKPEREKILKNK